MKILLLSAALLTSSLLLFSSKKDNPVIPPLSEPPKAVNLGLVDVSCTEAFIKVTAADSVLPLNISLMKDDIVFTNFTLTKSDIVVIDTTLQPDQVYTYQTTESINGKEEKSDTIQIKSLNITSNSFTWQKFTFGNGASSILRDVAIIDENNIWAVGAIYNDTTGLLFNVVHWEGSGWEPKRITINFRGNNITPDLNGIFAFLSTQIWLVSGLAIYGDGVNWTPYDVRQITGYDSLSFKKCWGVDNNDRYYSGLNGSIAHFHNGIWSNIESGTDLNVVDIWGDFNSFTNKTEIICGASNTFVNPRSELIRIKEDFTTEQLNKTGLGQTFAPLWFKSGIRYYVVGDGLYEKTYKDSSKWANLNNNITQYFMECIRGSALNNIIVAGAYGEVLHFNGISWISIKNSETTLNYGSYYRVAVKGNIVVAVGLDGNQAVILLGHQQ